MSKLFMHRSSPHPRLFFLFFFFLKGEDCIYINRIIYIYVSYPLKASLSQAVQNLKHIKLPVQTSGSISLSIHAVIESLITLNELFFIKTLILLILQNETAPSLNHSFL